MDTNPPNTNVMTDTIDQYEALHKKKRYITFKNFIFVVQNLLSIALSTTTTVYIVLLYYHTRQFFNKGATIIDNGYHLINNINMTFLNEKFDELLQLENCLVNDLDKMGLCKVI